METRLVKKSSSYHKLEKTHSIKSDNRLMITHQKIRCKAKIRFSTTNQRTMQSDHQKYKRLLSVSTYNKSMVGSNRLHQKSNMGLIDSRTRKINRKKKGSKLPLILSAGIAITLSASAIVTVPSPFNYIIAIAICGPLSASILGLKK